jgi:hypothetical protein
MEVRWFSVEVEQVLSVTTSAGLGLALRYLRGVLLITFAICSLSLSTSEEYSTPYSAETLRGIRYAKERRATIYATAHLSS